MNIADIVPWFAIGAYTVLILTGVGGLAFLIFKIGKWVSGVDSMKDDLSTVKDTVQMILERLPPMGETIEPGSPLQLTELGMEISRKLDARAMVIGYAARIVKDAKSKSAFDIQEMSNAFIAKEFENAASEEIKQIAYENGIGIDKVLAVLSVESRDELLKRVKSD